VIALALAAAAPALVALLGNRSFPLSPQMITVVVLAYLASGLMYPINIGPYVTSATRKVLPVFMVSMVASVALGWACTVVFGGVGACLALLLVYLLQSALLARLSNSLYPLRYEWARLGKVAAALGAGYLLVAGYTPPISAFGAAAVLWPVGVIALTMALLVLERFLEKSELEELKTIFGKLKPGVKSA
jgi:hypothetical protein